VRTCACVYIYGERGEGENKGAVEYKKIYIYVYTAAGLQ